MRTGSFTHQGKTYWWGWEYDFETSETRVLIDTAFLHTAQITDIVDVTTELETLAVMDWLDDVTIFEEMKRDYITSRLFGLRAKLYDRDKGKCRYCGTSLGIGWHVDHLYPKSRGGSNAISNLVASCPRCNMTKGARTPEEAGMELIALDE